MMEVWLMLIILHSGFEPVISKMTISSMEVCREITADARSFAGEAVTNRPESNVYLMCVEK